MRQRSEGEKAFGRAVADLFSSETGKRVLEGWRKNTVDAPTMLPAGHERRNPNGPADEGLYAAWRAGQNDVIFGILREIWLAQEGR